MLEKKSKWRPKICKITTIITQEIENASHFRTINDESNNFCLKIYKISTNVCDNNI